MRVVHLDARAGTRAARYWQRSRRPNRGSWCAPDAHSPTNGSVSVWSRISRKNVPFRRGHGRFTKYKAAVSEPLLPGISTLHSQASDAQKAGLRYRSNSLSALLYALGRWTYRCRPIEYAPASMTELSVPGSLSPDNTAVSDSIKSQALMCLNKASGETANRAHISAASSQEDNRPVTGRNARIESTGIRRWPAAKLQSISSRLLRSAPGIRLGMPGPPRKNNVCAISCVRVNRCRTVIVMPRDHHAERRGQRWSGPCVGNRGSRRRWCSQRCQPCRGRRSYPPCESEPL